MTTDVNKTRTFRPLKSVLSIGILFLLSISARTSMPQDHKDPKNRLDEPSARMEIQDPVPSSFVEKVAAVKAKQVWGEGALGKPVPLCDPDGDLVAWMFSYSIGRSEFPTYDELLKQIKKGRELKDLASHFKLREAKQLYESSLLCDSPRTRDVAIPSIPISPEGAHWGQVEPIRSDGSYSNLARASEIVTIRKYGEDKAIGAGEFGTIIVSATYNRVPVPVYLHYLAPYYTHFDQALEKARALIGEGATLNHIYFLRLRGLFFEFKNSGYSIVLQAQTLHPASIASGMSPMQGTLPKAQPTAAGREQINRLWAEFHSEIR